MFEFFCDVEVASYHKEAAYPLVNLKDGPTGEDMVSGIPLDRN
jgi:hypothetical protein